MANTKILCVDDDEKVLKGIQRQLGDDFDISTAIGPNEALELFESEGSFAVIISDMRMPVMNGVELLKRIREISPDTVRIILTGFAELNTIVDAVNQGHIFRFLAKPCSAEDMELTMTAALKQYALVESERELVEGTLRGSVKVLSEVLSLVNPLAFGQSSRVSATVDGMLKHLHVDDQWQLEIAAMLSSLGCVTLPPELLQNKLAGKQLSFEEETMISAHPAIAMELLHSIPRLEEVAEIIANQNTPAAADSIEGKAVSRESRILKIAFDFDFEELNSESSFHALNNLKLNDEKYDAEILNALNEFVKSERNLGFTEMMIKDLRQGMVLAEAITDPNGTLLMSKGLEMTTSASRLLANFSKNKTINEPVKVVCSLTPEELSA